MMGLTLKRVLSDGATRLLPPSGGGLEGGGLEEGESISAVASPSASTPPQPSPVQGRAFWGRAPNSGHSGLGSGLNPGGLT